MYEYVATKIPPWKCSAKEKIRVKNHFRSSLDYKKKKSTNIFFSGERVVLHSSIGADETKRILFYVPRTSPTCPAPICIDHHPPWNSLPPQSGPMPAQTPNTDAHAAPANAAQVYTPEANNRVMPVNSPLSTASWADQCRSKVLVLKPA